MRVQAANPNSTGQTSDCNPGKNAKHLHQKPRKVRKTTLTFDNVAFLSLSPANTGKNLIFSTQLVTKNPNAIYGL